MIILKVIATRDPRFDMIPWYTCCILQIMHMTSEEEVGGSQSILQIPVATSEDGGRYLCSAELDGNAVTTEAYLGVIEGVMCTADMLCMLLCIVLCMLLACILCCCVAYLMLLCGSVLCCMACVAFWYLMLLCGVLCCCAWCFVLPCVMPHCCVACYRGEACGSGIGSISSGD